MRKKLFAAVLLALLLMATRVSAAGGHFWLRLSDRHVMMDQTHQLLDEWFSLPAYNSFELTKDYTDRLGIRHQEYQQYVGGVRVSGGTVKVHGRDGMATWANGYVLEGRSAPGRLRRLPRSGALTPEGRTLVLVETDAGARYAYYGKDFVTGDEVYTDADTGEVLKRLSHWRTDGVTARGESVYSGPCEFVVSRLPDGLYAMADSLRNIYTLDARFASNDITDYVYGSSENPNDVYIDLKSYLAENCPVLTSRDSAWRMLRVDSFVIDTLLKCRRNSMLTLKLGSMTAAGQNEWQRTIAQSRCTGFPLKVDMTGSCVAADYSHAVNFEWRARNIGAINAQLQVLAAAPGAYGWELNVNDSDSVIGRGTYYVSSVPFFAVDAHWGMKCTHDYYKDVFGRNGFDNRGTAVRNIVFPPGGNYNQLIGFPYNNAAAYYDMETPLVVYGLGSNGYGPMVSLDVLAHEFTHLVTFSTANLEYQGESGALNESFSDIIGIAVKQAYKGCPDNWMIGDEVTGGGVPLRSMDNPENGVTPQPAVYKGKNWVSTAGPSQLNDYGGVHTNSGVQNRWFYLLCAGGEYVGADGQNCEVKGIGVDKAVQIAYRNLTELLTSKSDYDDAVEGSLVAAVDLFGENSSECESVRQAWAAVGLVNSSPSAISTQLAAPRPADETVYTLSGVRLDGSNAGGLAPGLYIRNGRKVVVR